MEPKNYTKVVGECPPHHITVSRASKTTGIPQEFIRECLRNETLVGYISKTMRYYVHEDHVYQIPYLYKSYQETRNPEQATIRKEIDILKAQVVDLRFQTSNLRYALRTLVFTLEPILPEEITLELRKKLWVTNTT